eukprot:gene28573-31734_t
MSCTGLLGRRSRAALLAPRRPATSCAPADPRPRARSHPQTARAPLPRPTSRRPDPPQDLYRSPGPTARTRSPRSETPRPPPPPPTPDGRPPTVVPLRTAGPSHPPVRHRRRALPTP